MVASTGRTQERLTYSIPEFAKLLGIGLNQAYEAAARKQIPAVKIGRRWLVPKKAGDRFLEEGEVA